MLEPTLLSVKAGTATRGVRMILGKAEKKMQEIDMGGLLVNAMPAAAVFMINHKQEVRQSKLQMCSPQIGDLFLAS